jgi:hypothetical protein
MFELSDVQGRVLSRHEGFEQGLGAFARAVRDGAPAETLTLRPVGGEGRPRDPAPEARAG